jgi:restriction system protein
MKFKMSEKSLFALLLRSPWWISFLVAAVLGLVATALLPKPVAAVGILFGFPFIVIGAMAAWRQRNTPNPARVRQVLQQCAAMTWVEFSQAVERAFTRQGYAVARLGGPAADLSLDKAGRVTLVSCKRWKAASLGIGVLTDLQAQRQAVEAHHCMYIGLGDVTPTARKFALEQGIQLLSEVELVQFLNHQ